jgi:hypothetical protein
MHNSLIHRCPAAPAKSLVSVWLVPLESGTVYAVRNAIMLTHWRLTPHAAFDTTAGHAAVRCAAGFSYVQDASGLGDGVTVTHNVWAGRAVRAHAAS